jgi:HlyD family secretion protein
MKRPLVIVLVLIAVAGAGFGLYWLAQTGQLPDFLARPATPVEQMAAADARPITAPSSIVAEGIVLPARYAALSMDATGKVVALPVAEGEQVAAGDVIARLESDAEVIYVAQAQAAVDQARAALERLVNGYSEEELAAAQAGVDAAAANLAILTQGAHPDDIAAAQAAVAAAQGAYALVAAGADDQALIAAQADMANAQAVLTQAQRAYDKVASESDIGARPESALLEQASNNFAAAQARYNDLAAGAEPGALAQAAAEVQQASAMLARLQSGATEAEIAAAAAEVRRAQAQYDLFAAGTRPEDIASAQAELNRVETELMQAQLALSKRELTAPFAGQLASLDLRLGQAISPSAPIAQLADISTWLVETTDLTEISIVDVAVGDTVQVEIDALPDVELQGTVTNIKPFGVNVLGDITYKVTVRLGTSDPRLRWNMTAAVTITP